jgi:hypothetical protein
MKFQASSSIELSEEVDRRPAPPRYSILRCSPFIALLAIMLGCVVNFADPDLWLHVLTGRAILSLGHIPKFDLYSYSAYGHPWHNHEWLSQVVFGLAYGLGGVIGLKIVKLALVAITMCSLAIGLSASRAAAGTQRLMMLATAAALIGSFQFRPQLFTFAMLSILMATLATELYVRPVRLWCLIPMFALWANFHAGFATGLAALAICGGVTAIQEFWAFHRLSRSIRLTGAVVGCAVATLVNPFGIGVWHTFTHSISDPVIRPYIYDWMPVSVFAGRLWHSSPVQVLQFALPLLLIAAFIVFLFAAPTLDDAPLVATALVFIAAAFYAQRNMPLAIIALSIPLTHHVAIAFDQHATSSRDRTFARLDSGGIVVAALAALVAIIGGVFSPRVRTWDAMPGGAVAFMRANGLHGNVLNNLDWGEYLIWHMHPESRVFIDGRSELVYSDKIIEDYLRFLFGRPGGEHLLERYPHDYVLVAPQSGAYKFASANPQWRIIYQDTVSVLFARSRSPIKQKSGPVEPAESDWNFP